MNVSLTPKLEQHVKSKVDGGSYNSASEVIRDALRLLEKQDVEEQLKLEALRLEIQKGLHSVSAGQVQQGDQVLQAIRQRTK